MVSCRSWSILCICCILLVFIEAAAGVETRVNFTTVIKKTHLESQAKGIAHHTDLAVAHYVDDELLSTWEKEDWRLELLKNQVRVTTANFLQKLLELKYFSLTYVNLLFVDECSNIGSCQAHMEVFVPGTTETFLKAFGDDSMSEALIKLQCRRFQLGWESVESSNTSSGRPSTSRTTNNGEHVLAAIKENQRLTVQELDEHLRILLDCQKSIQLF